MEIKIRVAYIIIYLVTISSSSSSSLVFTTNTSVVLDMDGNHLEVNTKYYVFSLSPRAGGLALSIRDRRNPCPPNVVQENDQSSKGLSLKIFPMDYKQVHVTMHSDLNIAFMAATVCVQSSVWRLANPDPFTRLHYVRSGAVLGRPGPETVGNWFKLDRFGEGYKILYCPSVCSSCRVQCGEVGLYVENGKGWLGLGGQPLVIAFKKTG